MQQIGGFTVNSCLPTFDYIRISMNSERAKFYTELMKTLTAFILGTSAGVYAIIIENKVEMHIYFTWFLATLDLLSLGILIALILYLDKNMAE